MFPVTPAPLPVHRVAILGAGTMGAGIASAALPVADVILVDPDPAALESARRRVRSRILREVRDGLLSMRHARRRYRRLHTEVAWSGDRHAQLIVEAVPEDAELKRHTLRSVEARLSPLAVWASNTSALPLHEIRRAALRPARVLGMHFFHPADATRLVEVAVHASADADALATARAFAVLLGKAVLDVRESPGFFTTRVLAAFTDEALLLLAEGFSPRTIDDAAERFGFVRGPLALLDHIGLDVAASIARNLHMRYATEGELSVLAPLLRGGLRGVKNGAGFYLHPGTARATENPAVPGLVGARGAAPNATRTIPSRLVLRFVNEVARAEHKRIVASRADADLACVLALGFPPGEGGPFQWAARQGHAAVAAVLHELTARHGSRFTPAPTWSASLQVDASVQP